MSKEQDPAATDSESNESPGQENPRPALSSKTAAMLATLALTPADALEVFRERQLPRTSIEVAHVEHARAILGAMGAALTGGDDDGPVLIDVLWEALRDVERRVPPMAPPSAPEETDARTPSAAIAVPATPTPRSNAVVPRPMPSPWTAGRGTAPPVTPPVAVPAPVSASSPATGPKLDVDALNRIRLDEERPATISVDSGLAVALALPFRDDHPPAPGDRQVAVQAAEVARPAVPFRSLLPDPSGRGRVAARPENSATPPPVHRPRSATDSTELSLEHCAALFAQCAASPQQSAAIWARYGLADEAAFRAVERRWRERFATDPQLLERWRALYHHYRNWYEQQHPR